MKERLLNIFKKTPAFPDGNSLCYKGEKDGHGQIEETPLVEGNIQTLFSEEIFPIPFNAGEIIRRQNGKT